MSVFIQNQKWILIWWLINKWHLALQAQLRNTDLHLITQLCMWKNLWIPTSPVSATQMSALQPEYCSTLMKKTKLNWNKNERWNCSFFTVLFSFLLFILECCKGDGTLKCYHSYKQYIHILMVLDMPCELFIFIQIVKWIVNSNSRPEGP